MVDQEIARRLRRHEELEEDESVQSPEPDPIDTNLPKSQTRLDGTFEIPVFAAWNDNQFEAKLKLVGKISNKGEHVLWNGKWRSRRRAAETAVRTIDPKQGYVNGMKFWHFRDPDDGSLRPVGDLYHAWYNDWDFILRVITNAKR